LSLGRQRKNPLWVCHQLVNLADKEKSIVGLSSIGQFSRRRKIHCGFVIKWSILGQTQKNPLSVGNQMVNS
jgi:hypothetical protein